jgi:hypothetical protein
MSRLPYSIGTGEIRHCCQDKIAALSAIRLKIDPLCATEPPLETGNWKCETGYCQHHLLSKGKENWLAFSVGPF